MGIANENAEWRTKIPGAADGSSAQRREGPNRFIQNRSRSAVVALKSDAAAEKSKIDFREIFRVVRFSTFATISVQNKPPGCPPNAVSGARQTSRRRAATSGFLSDSDIRPINA